MMPADNNATVSEEVRELYGNLSKHLAHSKCDCVTVEECYTKRLGLLSDALRKERELVLEEAADICDTWDSAALAATMIRALAAKGASHE
jgi:hypothetical protein